MAKEKLSANIIMKTLDFAYDKAVYGLYGFDSAQEMAENYMNKGGKKTAIVNSLIRWQTTKAGTNGFVAGLPGLIAMPVTIPAHIASALYVQVKMIAAIAYIGGHDITDDKVKSLVYLCTLGNGAKDIVKDIGIVTDKATTTSAIKLISGKTQLAINQNVGFKLLSQFSKKGAIHIGKAIPLLGGIIGATLDLATTNNIGNMAKNTFIGND